MNRILIGLILAAVAFVLLGVFLFAFKLALIAVFVGAAFLAVAAILGWLSLQRLRSRQARRS